MKSANLSGEHKDQREVKINLVSMNESEKLNLGTIMIVAVIQ